ncbi:nuclear transport factor 2 family protein [Actinoplanes sp. NPDC049265]|uniref:nuclear transport factor 2 family protein n=1 Tax=Actinoplanes sp. NPDC049265 TaxID=3363902 RepID=UPI003713C245
MSSPVVDRLLAAINARDPDGVAACFVEDYVCEWPAHPNLTFSGRENVRINQVMRYEQRPTVQAEIVHSVVVNDEVWGEWHFFDQDGKAERGVIVLVVDSEQDLIRSSRFYMEVVKDAVFM